MTPEDQVSNLELSKRLKELGVKQESFFTWVKEEGGEEPVLFSEDVGDGWMYAEERIGSAFTVAELGEMLPRGITLDESKPISTYYGLRIGHGSEWYIWYENCDYPVSKNLNEHIVDKSEANARAKMLIWLIENGKVKA